MPIRDANGEVPLGFYWVTEACTFLFGIGTVYRVYDQSQRMQYWTPSRGWLDSGFYPAALIDPANKPHVRKIKDDRVHACLDSKGIPFPS